MDKAFSDDVLEEGYNSDVIELDEDRRLVLRVAEHREATTLPLDELRDEVEQLVQARQQKEVLAQRAGTLIDDLKAGGSADLQWQQASDISRQADTSISQKIVDAAFRMPKPEEGQSTYAHVDVPDGVAIIALERVSQGEPNAEVEGFVAQMTEQLRGQAVIQGLIDYLHGEASIETDS
jgi:peptidyl-prolyl cis-trans isomerase D